MDAILRTIMVGMTWRWPGNFSMIFYFDAWWWLGWHAVGIIETCKIDTCDNIFVSYCSKYVLKYYGMLFIIILHKFWIYDLHWVPLLPTLAYFMQVYHIQDLDTAELSYLQLSCLDSFKKQTKSWDECTLWICFEYSSDFRTRDVVSTDLLTYVQKKKNVLK